MSFDVGKLRKLEWFSNVKYIVDYWSFSCTLLPASIWNFAHFTNTARYNRELNWHRKTHSFAISTKIKSISSPTSLFCKKKREERDLKSTPSTFLLLLNLYSLFSLSLSSASFSFATVAARKRREGPRKNLFSLSRGEKAATPGNRAISPDPISAAPLPPRLCSRSLSLFLPFSRCHFTDVFSVLFFSLLLPTLFFAFALRSISTKAREEGGREKERKARI